MITVAAYESTVRPPRTPGFGSLLLAEWTKLRTVRGWVVGLLLAVLLPVGITLLQHGSCGYIWPGGSSIGCAGNPTGPDGEAVVDTFYFVHQALPADGSITARVTSLTGVYSPTGDMQVSGSGTVSGLTPGVQPWSKAGIMIKASTKLGSAYAAMLVTGGNGVRMQWNYTGDTPGLPGPVSTSSPRWLRLTRSGSVVTGYESADGSTWTRVGSVSVRGLPASGIVQVGLFATSPSYEVITQSLGNSSGGGGPSLATGTFDNVAVSGGTGAGGTAGSWTGTSLQPPPPPGPPQKARADQAVNKLFAGKHVQTGASSFTVSGSGDVAPDVLDAPDGNGVSPQSELTGMFGALIVVIIVAALFIAAEYRKGMIRVTLAASPSRWTVLAAKSVVIGLVTFAISLIAVGITLPVGLHNSRSDGYWIPPITALTEVRMIVGTALLLALTAVLALAIATMLRRSVLAVAGVIVVLFVPYLLAHVTGILPVSAQDWLLRVTPTAAFSIQQAYPAYHQVLAPYSPADGFYPLSPLAGIGVLVAWTVVALLAAGWLLRRRDA
jgi:ABC-type transport system involved in multi-copper enzyme maturation permease subunit